MIRFPLRRSQLPLKLLLGILLLVGGALLVIPALAARPGVDLLLVLDNSGSMQKLGKQTGNDPQYRRVAAVQYLVEKMGPQDRLALVAFDNDAHTDPAASRLQTLASPADKAAFYDGLRRLLAQPTGSTNIAAGMKEARRILQAQSRPDHRRFLLLLTDGTPNPAVGDNTPDALRRLAGRMGREGVQIHTVGLGALSPRPDEERAAEKLLQDIARLGNGVPHRARSAEDLPSLFGGLFAQLVGGEVSRLVPAGETATFPLSSDARDLRILSASDSGAPELSLTGPGGRAVPAKTLPPALPGRQSAQVGVAQVAQPAPGQWAVRADGAVEIAYRPGFQAALLQPRHNEAVPAHASLPIQAELRGVGGPNAPLIRDGKVVVEYESESGAKPVTVTLRETSPGRFAGTLPDTGAVGPHHLRARGYRVTSFGEEEGGSAYAELQVGRLPALTLLSPKPGAAYTVADAIPVRARATLEGRPIEDLSELKAVAQLKQNGKTVSTVPLRPAGEGRFAGELKPGSEPGAAELSVTLSGAFEGTALKPLSRSVPLQLTPRPVVELQWPDETRFVADPDDRLTLTLEARSSAGEPVKLRLQGEGVSGLTVNPKEWVVEPNRSGQRLKVVVSWSGLEPGDATAVLSAELTESSAELKATPYGMRIHIRDWLERNRWWLYPAVALLVLLIVGGFLLASWRAKVWAERRRRMLNALNRVELTLTYTNQVIPRKPLDALPRNGFTVGGTGSDVLVVDEADPTSPPFKEPRLRVDVKWDRKPVILVSPVGGHTAFYNKDDRLITEPIRPTEGGEEFRVMPENVTLRVSAF